MAHPRMFDDDDPLLARVRALALALPDAQEKVSHGRPAFYTNKVFAYFGGSLKLDGAWVQRPASILVLPDVDEREALVQDARAYVPGYLGAYGWLGLDLPAARARADAWAEIGELLEESYRNTAGPRRVAALDARTRP